MRRLLYAAVALLLAAPAGVALADNPVTPVDGGTLIQQCYAHASSSVDDPGYRLCRSVEAAADVGAAACRMPLRSVPGAPDDATDNCGVIDGREVSEAQVSAYEHSWVHQALSLQRGISDQAPLIEEQILHTHNSFNASAYQLPTDGSLPSYYPTLTNQDPNQVYSITDQMRMDVRAVEIDLHWVPSPYGSPATNGYWVTMCHGDGEDPAHTGYTVHVGCTDDRPLQDGLAELRRWLDANPHEFLLVYLENQLAPAGPIASQQQAHAVAAQIIQQQLGSRVYRPQSGLASGSCAPMPYDVTANDVLASGAQVMLVGNCGPGAWNQWVFTRGPKWQEDGGHTSYGGADCAADQATRASDSAFVRYYQESPWLQTATAGTPAGGGSSLLTPQMTADMTRCGADLIGFDQLQPFDGRLAASVWSWAKDEPASTGQCAYQGSDGRFHATSCSSKLPFACEDGNQVWHVTSGVGPFGAGGRRCAGAAFATPANGYRQAQLAAAKPAGVPDVWVNYRVRNGAWQATVPRFASLPHTG